MRRLLALSFAVIAAASGCRMCASPYDYCGPVMDDCCCGSDYQPEISYQGVPAENIEQGVVEQQEPVYYEGASIPRKSATQSPRYEQRVPAAQLPRQAKKPGRGLF